MFVLQLCFYVMLPMCCWLTKCQVAQFDVRKVGEYCVFVYKCVLRVASWCCMLVLVSMVGLGMVKFWWHFGSVLFINWRLSSLTEVYCYFSLSLLLFHSEPFDISYSLCFWLERSFSNFCLLTLPMDGNCRIHNCTAQWGPTVNLCSNNVYVCFVCWTLHVCVLVQLLYLYPLDCGT